MLEARADVMLGEAIEPAAVAYRRLAPSHWISGIWPGLGFLAGWVLLIAINYLLLQIGWYSGLTSFFVGAICLVGGMLLGFQLAARQHRLAFLASLRRYGSPEVFPTRFSIEPDSLRIDSDRLGLRIAWPAVLFLARGEEHWLVQADSMTIAIPRRAFANASEETTFVQAILERVNPEVRERSENATQEHHA